MRKLDFLLGRWSGEARLWKTASDSLLLAQTEEVQYKLDGLLLVIEGIGQRAADNKPALQAFGIISYEDESGTYRMRAFNDGRFLETEVKLLEDGKSLTWGFAVGAIRTKSVLHVNEKEEWSELAEIALGSQPSRRLLELAVQRQR